MLQYFSFRSSRRPCLLIRAFSSPCFLFRSSFHGSTFFDNVGPAAKDSQEIERILAGSSWSVRSLFKSETSDRSTGYSIARERLHHLLRLSALPLPEAGDEEARLLDGLESQLKFVKAIQRVDTEGVEPLVSLRDETKECYQEEEISLDTLREEFNKEEVLGDRGRIRRKSEVQVKEDDAENWDVLALAPKTKGRFISLETK